MTPDRKKLKATFIFDNGGVNIVEDHFTDTLIFENNSFNIVDEQVSIPLDQLVSMTVVCNNCGDTCDCQTTEEK